MDNGALRNVKKDQTNTAFNTTYIQLSLYFRLYVEILQIPHMTFLVSSQSYGFIMIYNVFLFGFRISLPPKLQ